MKFITFILLCLLYSLSFQSLSQGGDKIQEGLKFSSNEVIKDARTGLNITPLDPIRVSKRTEISFDLAYWRFSNAYGHIFRIITGNKLNIDLVSKPSNAVPDDLILIIGDSVIAMSYSFEEIGLTKDKWASCKLIIDQTKKEISLSIAGKIKSKDFKEEVKAINVVFGKNNSYGFITSDVPPINVRNIAIINSGKTIRHWTLGRHLINKCYDEIDNHQAIALNPNWIIDQHVKWKPLSSFEINGRPQVVFDNKKTIYFLNNRSITTIDCSSGIISTKKTNNNANVPLAQQSLFFSPKNEIWTFDLDSLAINKFSIKENRWIETNSFFKSEPNRWHINKLNLENKKFVFFSGYGFFRYHNTLFTYENNKWTFDTLKTIEPRYLSATALDNNGQLLLFGGYGSKSGKQEFGSRSFHQLHIIDTEKKESRKLWEIDDTYENNYAYSNSLILSPDSSFMVLRYEKDEFKTHAFLEKHNTTTGKITQYSDSLSFDFHDISSYADLLLDTVNNRLIALLMNEKKDGLNKVSVFTIKSPPKLEAEISQPTINNISPEYLLYTIFLIVIISITLVLFRKRKAKINQETTQLEIRENLSPVEFNAPDIKQEKSAILFLGGFQVIDKDGNDISGKFTSTLRLLFCLIILHSEKNKKGISSGHIWEYIWGDKTESSARNNRNVNIKRLREILKDVGNICIINNGDYWILEMSDDVFYDYGFILQLIEEPASIPPSFVELAKKGNILPSIETEWIDTFKSKFSNDLVDLLIKLSENFNENNHMQIEIADAIFKYDSINQNALILKCQALDRSGKFALAKKCYENYTNEYKVMYDEDFETSFEKIINIEKQEP